jgi:hypothetical protein
LRRWHPAGGVFVWEAVMLWWIGMRNAAVIRHLMVWFWCGADPSKWPPHMDMVRAVYGF